MSISVKAVSKLYKEQKALNNISIDVNPGEIVGFLGPNGAGKSTMMKIITGFIPPTVGSVLVCGHDVESDGLEVKKKVGYLPEHNPLYLDMYVKEYLLFMAGLHKVTNRAEAVKDIIEKVGLGIEQHKKIGALSKGYRQRVGLAQALIHDPEVLILDEPTTGLDPNQIGDIRSLIKKVGTHKTVMLSTHIMQEVEAICDRVIIINKGEIVANESVENIKQMKSTSSILKITFSKSIDESKLLAIDGVETAILIADQSWEITSSKDIDIRNALTNFATAHELAILNLSLKESSLESIFKQLTSNN